MSPLTLLELLRIAVDLRGRTGGRYWRWRIDTAVGSRGVGKGPMRRAAGAFADWRRTMRGMIRDGS